VAEPKRWSVNDSAQHMSDYQAQWCCSTLENQEPAIQNQKKSPLILPGELREQEPLVGILTEIKV